MTFPTTSEAIFIFIQLIATVFQIPSADLQSRAEIDNPYLLSCNLVFVFQLILKWQAE